MLVPATVPVIDIRANNPQNSQPLNPTLHNHNNSQRLDADLRAVGFLDCSPTVDRTTHSTKSACFVLCERSPWIVNHLTARRAEHRFRWPLIEKELGLSSESVAFLPHAPRRAHKDELLLTALPTNGFLTRTV